MVQEQKIAVTDNNWEVVNSEMLLEMTNALKGYATCGTVCGCCQMHNRIARDLLARWGIKL